MTDHPIIFSDPMVSALLDGRKTVTRRVVGASNAPDDGYSWRECCCAEIDPADTPCIVCDVRYRVRYRAGDRLWVRETWADGLPDGPPYRYRATNGDGPEPPRWRPSISMPRAACRLHMEVVSVRCEHLHDITAADIIAEGIESEDVMESTPTVADFATVWDAINGHRPGCAWSDNPLVWRIEFRRVA